MNQQPNQEPSSPVTPAESSELGRAPRRTVLSIKSIMVITAVFAAAAVSMGQLWRAAQGDWFFKIFGGLIK